MALRPVTYGVQRRLRSCGIGKKRFFYQKAKHVSIFGA
jgi:hypothetical protein